MWVNKDGSISGNVPKDSGLKRSMKKLGIKESVSENTSEIKKIIQYFIKKGDNKETALDKIKQNYKYVSKKYKSAPVHKKAEILTSLQEGKANIYGFDYRENPKDRKFKRASLTMASNQGIKMHKKMTMAIMKKADKLRKQNGWAEYRLTVNGQPYISMLGSKRMTRYPKPMIYETTINEAIYFDEEKMLKLIDKDKFLKYTLKSKYKGKNKTKDLESMFNTFIRGDSNMERIYRKI